jgi:PhoPQ-activated pathogenicity-related protein
MNDTPPSKLHEYMDQQFPEFAWEIVSQSTVEGTDIGRVDLSLTSQCWQGILWTHHLHLFIPEYLTTELADQALLTIVENGPASDFHASRSVALAQKTGMVCAVLCDVPNQPLFEGKVEDALIAHTFLQHLDTSEPYWPLLLPMARSASAAMTAVQQFCSTHHSVSIQRFVVTGASKRGWTTWLAAACDTRISAIAPVVFDNLNFFAQMPHQLEVFDRYSDEINDYTSSGVVDRMMTPEGYRLVQLVDPYSYRSLLQMPKLIINGSNDPYWATDAINIYWDGLPGQKSVLYIPNQGHALNDVERFEPALATFCASTHAGSPLPAVALALTVSSEGVSAEIACGEVPLETALWWAETTPGSRDFRQSTWNRVTVGEGELSASIGIPARLAEGRSVAAFAEASFKGPFGTYWLSSPMQAVRL